MKMGKNSLQPHSKGSSSREQFRNKSERPQPSIVLNHFSDVVLHSPYAVVPIIARTRTETTRSHNGALAVHTKVCVVADV